MSYILNGLGIALLVAVVMLVSGCVEPYTWSLKADGAEVRRYTTQGECEWARGEAHARINSRTFYTCERIP